LLTLTTEPLDPDFQKLIDIMAAAKAAGAPEWHTLSPQQIREITESMRGNSTPVEGVACRDLEVTDNRVTLPARLYVPEGAEGVGPGLVYFHGGGFTIGSIQTHDGLVARLALASGVKVLSVGYRLAPENPFPAAHDDALMSARWAFDNAEAIGFDPGRIAVGGDSAGANLASSVCLDMRSDPDRNVKFQLLFYPNTTINDIAGSRTVYARGYFLTLETAHHLFRQYVTGEQATAPRIDLLHRTDLEGLPPTFFSVGQCDILFDECVAYAKAMMEANVEVNMITYPGYIHSFYGFFEQVPAVAAAFEEAGAALSQGLMVSSH
jgi:acetyl esterase